VKVAEGVAVGRAFDLDDLGAEAGEDSSGGRGSDVGSGVDDAQAGQWKSGIQGAIVTQLRGVRRRRFRRTVHNGFGPVVPDQNWSLRASLTFRGSLACEGETTPKLAAPSPVAGSRTTGYCSS
jgi:hypothetical protein